MERFTEVHIEKGELFMNYMAGKCQQIHGKPCVIVTTAWESLLLILLLLIFDHIQQAYDYDCNRNRNRNYSIFV